MATVVGLLRDGRLGRQLKFLDVSANKLGDAGVTALAAVLPPTLESAGFAKLGCGDVGMLALARALDLTSVGMVMCNDNPAVTEAGWTALGAALPTMGTEQLTLRADIGDAGLVELSRRLPESSVRALTLDGDHDVGDAGARALAAAIPRCPQLVALRVDNTISAEGTAALRAAPAPQGLTLNLPESGWSSWTAPQ